MLLIGSIRRAALVSILPWYLPPGWGEVVEWPLGGSEMPRSFGRLEKAFSGQNLTSVAFSGTCSDSADGWNSELS